MSRCDYELLQGPRCCADAGHEGSHRYKCAGEQCPGLTYPAHVLAHPASCLAVEDATIEAYRGISHNEKVRMTLEAADTAADFEAGVEAVNALLRPVDGEDWGRHAAAKLGREALDGGNALELAAAVDELAGRAIERHRRRFTIGTRIKTLRGFSGVPIGTEGIVDEHYTAGVMVAWDLEDRPLRPDYAERLRGGLHPLPQWAVGAPLRDGFSYGDLAYLEVLEAPGAATTELEEAKDGR